MYGNLNLRCSFGVVFKVENSFQSEIDRRRNLSLFYFRVDISKRI